MRIMFQLAWRNIWRNKRRSWLTIAAISLGYLSALMTMAVGDSAYTQTIDMATGTLIGHMQIQRRGYKKTPKVYESMGEQELPSRWLRGLFPPKGKKQAETQPSLSVPPPALGAFASQIKGWSPRIQTAALLSTGAHSAGAWLMGLRLVQEQDVTHIPEEIVKALAFQAIQSGHFKERMPLGYLDAIRQAWTNRMERARKKKSKKMTNAEEITHLKKAIFEVTRIRRRELKKQTGMWNKLLRKKEILLGKELAKQLRASIGDAVAVVTVAADGSTGNERFRLIGTLETGNPAFDRSLGMTTLGSLQELLSLEGRVHQFVLGFHRLDRLSAFTKVWRQALHTSCPKKVYEDCPSTLGATATAKQTRHPYEVLPWQEVSPELHNFIRLDRGGAYLTMIIIFVLVAFGILNTLLMSVLERTREFGLLMSLGVSKGRLTAMILMEGLCMGGVSILVGTLLSLPLLSYLSIVGIPLSEPMQVGGYSFQLVLSAILTWEGVFFSIFLVLITTLLVSLYPALRTTHAQPADALRAV